MAPLPLEAIKFIDGEAVGGERRGGLLRVGHQGFQMEFSGIHHMHLNELCGKLHCTEVNLDVNVV